MYSRKILPWMILQALCVVAQCYVVTRWPSPFAWFGLGVVIWCAASTTKNYLSLRKMERDSP